MGSLIANSTPSIYHIFLYFIAYSLFGWVFETVLVSVRERKYAERGFLAGPICPIYGCGALLFLQIQQFSTNPFILFLLCGVSACVLEYITSYIMEVLFNARWWDYSWRRFNFNGRICLTGFLAFGGFGAVLPFVHRYLRDYLLGLSPRVVMIVAIVLFVIFLADLVLTCLSLSSFNRFMLKYQKELERRATPIRSFIKNQRDSFSEHYERTRVHINDMRLSFFQSRIFHAFPGMSSTKYQQAIEKLREIDKKPSKKSKK